MRSNERAYRSVHGDVAKSTVISIFSTRPTGLENVTILYRQNQPGTLIHTLPKSFLIPASSSSRGKLVTNKVERHSMVTDISWPSSFRRSFARADATDSTAWNSSRAASDARASSDNIVVSRIRPHCISAPYEYGHSQIRKRTQSVLEVFHLRGHL